MRTALTAAPGTVAISDVQGHSKNERRRDLIPTRASFGGSCAEFARFSGLELLPAGSIGPCRLFAGTRIQYQSMRRIPRLEIKHIDERTGQRVERKITYPAQIPVVFEEPQN
jgi:hypothetical protein